MEAVRSLEKSLGQLYKSAPHTPVTFRKWLGENVWWIALIGVVLSVLSLLVLIPLTFAALGLGAFVATSPYASGYSYASNGVVALVSLTSLVVTTILMAMAISPLKAKAKKGWTLLFISALVSLALSAVIDIIILDVFGLLMTVIWAAIAGYLLFEIHSEFGGKHAVKSKK